MKSKTVWVVTVNATSCGDCHRRIASLFGGCGVAVFGSRIEAETRLRGLRPEVKPKVMRAKLVLETSLFE